MSATAWPEIFALADRVTVLRDGEHVGDAGRSARSTSAELISMMVGRAIDQLFPKLEAKIGAPVLEVRDLVSPAGGARRLASRCARGEILGSPGWSARAAPSWR